MSELIGVVFGGSIGVLKEIKSSFGGFPVTVVLGYTDDVAADAPLAEDEDELGDIVLPDDS